MPTAQAKGKNLLDVVKRMGPAGFNAFIEAAFSVRAQPETAKLSAAETNLLR